MVALAMQVGFCSDSRTPLEGGRMFGFPPHRSNLVPATLLAWVLVTPALGGPGGDGWPTPGGVIDPVTVTSVASVDGVRPGDELRVAALLNFAGPEWHVNSSVPLEEWLIPTELFLDEDHPFGEFEIAYPPGHEVELAISDVPMSVYEGTVPIGVAVRVPDSATEFVTVSGVVSYQACNDQNCLAPTDKPFSIRVPVIAEGTAVCGLHEDIFSGAAADGSIVTPGIADGDIGESIGFRERLQAMLANNFGNPIVALLLTFLAGLLSAATPCVYPMIPITARILMGRGGDNPALGRLHAFMYFVGIILIYAILGLIAASTGGGFNALMQLPLIILSFAVLFFILGLSMLGMFEIQLPHSFTSKVDDSTSNKSGVAGTMLMGVGAGLVVSPCVGPVVIFILTQIAAQIAAVEAAGGGAVSRGGQIAYGSYLMAGYGAGLGIPFLLVGLFSARSMAKPGPWMTLVRAGLGVVILYFAYDYFHKAMSTAGVDRGLATAVLTGVILVFLAVLGGVFRAPKESHDSWPAIKHASTIVMLVVGCFFLWTGLSRSGVVGGPVEYAPVGSVGTEVAAIEDSHGLTWHRDFEAAKEEAAATGRAMFVDFYANWCANCKVFSKQAAKAGPLRSALEDAVRLKVYDTDPIFEELKQDPRFPELKREALPFFVIFDARGEFRWKGSDYRAHRTFIRELELATNALESEA
jgi:thiol:disulfide interchange protein DsbD